MTSSPLSSLRVLGLCSSEPEYFTRVGGVGAAKHHLFSEIAGRAGAFDLFQPTAEGSVAIPAGVERRTWKRSPRVFTEKSRAVERYIEDLELRPDLLFQWEFFFAPNALRACPVPYVLYNDWTTRLTQREFPGWADEKAYEPFHEIQIPLLQGAAHVFTFSDKTRRSVIDDYGVQPDKATCVYAGVNLEEFPEWNPAKDYEPERILFIGNDYEAKGLPTLLSAFGLLLDRYPRASLTVVGEPAGWSGVCPEGVEVLGPVSSPQQLRSLFHDATVFVLPSRMEAFGHVYAEAMAHQLPCIGSDIGAVGEIIEDGRSGFVVREGDSGALASRLDQLLASADLRAEMGRIGYERSRSRFRWDVVVDKMDSVISQLRL